MKVRKHIGILCLRWFQARSPRTGPRCLKSIPSSIWPTRDGGSSRSPVLGPHLEKKYDIFAQCRFRNSYIRTEYLVVNFSLQGLS